MRRSPVRAAPIGRGVIAFIALSSGALISCGNGGDTERAETATTKTTTEETVLGVTVTRGGVAAAAPAVPVPVDIAASSTVGPSAPPATPPTTRAPRPTATTAVPVTTTTTPPARPRPNGFVGTYTARPGTDHVIVELFSNGAVFDSRELGGTGSFEFAGLPDGAYRIVVTDTIDDEDPDDGYDTSSRVVSSTDSLGLTDGDTAHASCDPGGDCFVSVEDGG